MCLVHSIYLPPQTLSFFWYLALPWNRPLCPLLLSLVFMVTVPARLNCVAAGRASGQGSVSPEALLCCFCQVWFLQLILGIFYLITPDSICLSHLNTCYLFSGIANLGGRLVPFLIRFFEIAFLFNTKIWLLVMKETLSGFFYFFISELAL